MLELLLICLREGLLLWLVLTWLQLLFAVGKVAAAAVEAQAVGEVAAELRLAQPRILRWCRRWVLLGQTAQVLELLQRVHEA